MKNAKLALPLLVLALVLLSGCLAGAGTPAERSISIFGNWQDFSILVLLATFLIMALAWMVAYSMGFKELEIFAKNEFFQVLASAFIFANIVFFVTLIDATSQQYGAQILAYSSSSAVPMVYDAATNTWSVTTGANFNVSNYNPTTGRWITAEVPSNTAVLCQSPCHFYLARAFLGTTFEKTYRMADSAVRSYAKLAYLDRVRMGAFIEFIGVFGISLDIAPFSGVSIIYDSIDTALDVMIKVMMALKFQEFLLLYLQNGVFPIFLVAGIILRSVWFMRKLGGLMIAIAVGVYTILPLMYVLAWYTIDTGTTVIDFDVGNLVPASEASIGSYLSPSPSTLAGFDPRLTLFTEYNSTGQADTVGLLDATSRLLIPAFALPVLCAFTTIAFIKALSPALGGDVEIAGLTRLI
ncbi:MAG: hypothetical protein NT157_00485 [Candidatus Micrarchaeota archaeon]|nr:hypothetical protein [Candidatus Micrarchaeota archaeon]